MYIIDYIIICDMCLISHVSDNFIVIISLLIYIVLTYKNCRYIIYWFKVCLTTVINGDKPNGKCCC